jgi:hypothetical protein
MAILNLPLGFSIASANLGGGKVMYVTRPVVGIQIQRR